MYLNKTIPFSILELATVPAGTTPGDVFKNSLDLAQHAEALGYHRFWLAEHHNMVSISMKYISKRAELLDYSRDQKHCTFTEMLRSIGPSYEAF